MALSKEKIEYFKEKLIIQKSNMEKELGNVGRRNPDVPGDWEATKADMNTMKSDNLELADSFEEQENRAAIEDTLEGHLVLVKEALQRVEKGTYGICGTCGEPIDEKRLEAYPAAKNCIKHANNKKI